MKTRYYKKFKNARKIKTLSWMYHQDVNKFHTDTENLSYIML